MVLGTQYQLARIHFHNPSEFTIEGKSFDMEAQLVMHQTEDGRHRHRFRSPGARKREPGDPGRLEQPAAGKWRGSRPPGQTIDVNLLLPANKNYFTFMGSLTTPPCTGDVLWMVIKQPQQVSSEQLSMLQRLYRPNARPVQPALGRIIKESR